MRKVPQRGIGSYLSAKCLLTYNNLRTVSALKNYFFKSYYRKYKNRNITFSGKRIN